MSDVIDLVDDDDSDEVKRDIMYTLAQVSAQTLLDVIQVKAQDLNDALVGLDELVDDMRNNLRRRYAAARVSRLQ